MQLLYWFFGNFTTCIPILLISQSLYILTFPLWCPSRKRKFKKTPNQATKQTNKQKSPLHSSVFRAAPIILVALGPMVWHAVYLCVQSDPHENFHCDESLVWLKVSGIWTLTETPLHYPAAAPSRGDPAEPVPSHVPAGPRWVDAIVGQLKALILPWEVGNLVSIGPQAAPSGHQWASSPTPIPSGPAVACLCWGVGPSLLSAGTSPPCLGHWDQLGRECQGQFSCHSV